MPPHCFQHPHCRAAYSWGFLQTLVANLAGDILGEVPLWCATCIRFRLICAWTQTKRQHEPEVFSCVDSWQVCTLSAYPNPGGAILPNFLPVIFLVSYSSIYTLIGSFSLPGTSWGAWQLGIHTWVLTSCRSVGTLCRFVLIPYKMQCRYQIKTGYPTYKGIIVLVFHCLSVLQDPALQAQVDERHGSLPYSCL